MHWHIFNSLLQGLKSLAFTPEIKGIAIFHIPAFYFWNFKCVESCGLWQEGVNWKKRYVTNVCDWYVMQNEVHVESILIKFL